MCNLFRRKEKIIAHYIIEGEEITIEGTAKVIGKQLNGIKIEQALLDYNAEEIDGDESAKVSVTYIRKATESDR